MKLLHVFLKARVRSTFHKLNVHTGKIHVHITPLFLYSQHPTCLYPTALQPEDICRFLKPVFDQAKAFQHIFKEVQSAEDASTSVTQVPSVTVSQLSRYGASGAIKWNSWKQRKWKRKQKQK